MEMTGEYTIPAPREKVWEALNDPEVLMQGLPETVSLHGEPLIDILEDALCVVADGLRRRDLMDDGRLEQVIRTGARRCINKYWGKKAVIDVTIVRV